MTPNMNFGTTTGSYGMRRVMVGWNSHGTPKADRGSRSKVGRGQAQGTYTRPLRKGLAQTATYCIPSGPGAGAVASPARPVCIHLTWRRR